MKKYLIAISCLSISAYAIAKERPSIESNFPVCGQSILNEKNITKVCATRDFTALEPRKRKKDWLAFLAAEGSSGYKGSRDPVGGVLEFQNQELDMQGHIWDFSQQGEPGLILKGGDSIIKNGIILKANIYLGNSDSDLIKTFQFENMKAHSLLFALWRWKGIVDSSKLLINQNISVYRSNTTIINNQIISQANLKNNGQLFNVIQQPKSTLISFSAQIFPDEIDGKITIPNALYVKFSPDTIIDGNTFTLTQKNDQAYAIVLDHSPRVRITNNTFNGFKVPILMDQWSSIVDEKGNEIKPENFKGYGNVINPNKFAGHVTMNRKGDIVRK
ncbi:MULTISPECIES: hypothetical protein [Acinetobacter]|uniref:hypothetical protein n=1 Tax=Acinetobacter TaxID=469 RepID=UPI00124EE930|nr:MULTISPECIES: hypothetical protein [Acinetobacter]MDA3506858.1 hypothetical protein [Acinetobacter junii]MDA3531291.1 hypothetical protein [Acinetobacter junii]